jgi:hypothetical protein
MIRKNEKGLAPMFSGILIIFISVVFLGIIIAFTIGYFNTLEDQQKYNNNKIILTTLNTTLTDLKESSVGTYKKIDISNDDIINIDQDTRTIIIEQEITNNQMYNRTKDTLSYGNLTITKTQNKFVYTLSLTGIVDFNSSIIILPGNHTLSLNVVDFNGNIPVIRIGYAATTS